MAWKEDREYRMMPLMEFRQAENDEPSYRIEGYASTFEPYLLYEEDDKKIYERIEPTAFDKADMSDVLFLYNHEGQVMARQKNGSLALNVDGNGLHVVADLGGSSRGREMAEEIRSGLVDQMSFAFTVAEGGDTVERSEDKKTYTRVIKQFRKLYDVSAVSVPANPTTSIACRSAIDGAIKADEAERLQQEADERERLAKEDAERRAAAWAILKGGEADE